MKLQDAEKIRVEVDGIAIDDDGTIVREDALWIDETMGGWRVRVSVPDACCALMRDEEPGLSTRDGGPRRRDLSLTDQRAVPAVTIEITILKEGRVESFRVFRSSLRLSAVTTFAEFIGTMNSAPIRGAEDIGAAAMALRSWRLATWDERLTLPTIARNHRAAVNEILVSANLAATRFVHRQGRSLVYTCPSGPQSNGGRRRWSVYPERMDRQMATEYANFTTPLNRYSDLVNLGCLLAAADGIPEPYSLTELATVADAQMSADAGASRLRRFVPNSIAGIGSSASALSHLVVDACRGKATIEGLDAEIMRRLSAGDMGARTMPWILLHPRSPASAETKAKAVAVLRSAASGVHLVGFWAQASDMFGTTPIAVDIADGDEEVGYSVRVRHGEVVEIGHGPTPEKARRDALGRLAATATGADPDAEAAPEGRLMVPHYDRLTQALRFLGWLPHETNYVTSANGFVAHVVVRAPDGRTFNSSASATTKARAVEAACENVCSTLPSPPIPMKPPALPSAELIAEISRLHEGYPDRMVSALCKRASLGEPEIETLRSPNGVVRSRVAAAGFVSVGIGASVKDARARAAAEVLSAITSLVEGMPGARP